MVLVEIVSLSLDEHALEVTLFNDIEEKNIDIQP